jgi:hypothetical protein
MIVVLEAVAGPIIGRRIEVRAGSILRLGRTTRSDYAIGEDSYLSGQHFAVECDGTQCRVRDLGSSNGTFVNGDRITEVIVREGDSVLAGESTFTVHLDMSAAAAQSAPAGSRTATVPTLVSDMNRTRLDRTSASTGSKPTWDGFSRSQTALLHALYHSGEPVYAVLDASRDARIPAFLEASGVPYQSLGIEDRILAYVVSLPPGARLLDVLVKDGWGHGWGFYFISRSEIAQLTAHWQRLLVLYTADSVPFVFRFWDPRVLRALAPAMAPSEASAFFGPVSRMIVESEKPEVAVEISLTPRGGRQQSLVLA